MNRGLAVVTGASSGIGAEFAKQLKAAGYSLLLIARRQDQLQAVADAIGGATCLPADLTNDADLERIARQLESLRPTLLVNNAGFGSVGRLWETDWQRQLDMHRLHVLATIRLTRAVLPAMVEKNAGGVIHVSSVAAYARSAGNVSYCATKAWMSTFAEGLYLELKAAAPNVRMQALCPGFTYSEFHDVIGVDRAKVASWLWMPAPFVVAESLRGLERGKLFVVPGWRYRLFTAIWSKLPAGLRVRLETRNPHRRDR